MKKITFVYYRRWAHNILLHIISLKKTQKDFEIGYVIIPVNSCFLKDLLRLKLNVIQVDPLNSDQVSDAILKSDSDLVFAFSWSWRIPSSVVKQKICLCLHPSNLPSYAGGTPIQNQVFDGLYDSKVSVFKMTNKLDYGPIYMQCALSLFGGIEEVFERITSIGRSISEQVISDYVANKLKFKEISTIPEYPEHYSKIRGPADSQLYLNDLKTISFNFLTQKIKILLNPYPNAFISVGDNIIKLKSIKRIKKVKPDYILLSENIEYDVKIETKCVLILEDGYALISDFELLKAQN